MKKLGGKFGIVLIATMAGVILAPALLVLAEAEPTPKVVINELAWAGSSQSTSDEWIELKNLETEAVDMSGWQLTKNTGAEQLMVTIPAGASLPAGGYYLIAHFDAANSVLAVEPDLLEAAISLSNTKLQIKLYKADWSLPENLIDTAGDGGVPPAGNNATKSSMERNDDSGGWHDAVSSVNLDSGAADLATPASENSQLVEPPTLETITPNQVENTKALQIESITGTNFDIDTPPTVQLKLGGQTITADNVHVANPGLIDGGQLATNGAEIGQWDLVLVNANGQTATLPQAVEITEPPEQYDLATTVRINEVYPQPNTTSNDEFIELYNLGEKTVNLNGWVLDDVADGGSSPLTMKDKNILPKSYLTIYKSESKLTLNDSGDSVYLIQPNGFELDRTSYVEADRGRTWSRFDDGWKWTSSPTPNGKNAWSEPPAPPTEPPAVDEPDDVAALEPTFKEGEMMITELLPNPEDADEFIELFNASNQPIDLKDWRLQDKSKHKYKIANFAVNIQTANSLTVQPQQYVVITGAMSGIALNNTGGESVTLLDPAGNVIATASYPDKAPVGAAYVWADGIWTWSHEATPGEVNVLGLDEADEASPAVDVVLPETLPVTGKTTMNKIGLALVSLALGAILGWSYVYRRHQKFSRDSRAR